MKYAISHSKGRSQSYCASAFGAEGWGKLYSGQLCGLYCSPDIIFCEQFYGVVRGGKCDTHEREINTGCLCENLKKRDSVERQFLRQEPTDKFTCLVCLLWFSFIAVCN
jgi:hypothetical protein